MKAFILAAGVSRRLYPETYNTPKCLLEVGGKPIIDYQLEGIQNIGIHICCKGRSLKDDSMKIERSGNKIILEGLPIADVNHPKLPFYYFNEILRKIGNINNEKDILLKILNLNILIREKILDESKLVDNQVSKTLTKLMLYEINLISSHD